MNLRPAIAGDLDRCQRLDGSYTTNYVWQMDENVDAYSLAVAFRRVRVPRPIQVSYPRPVRDLQEDWRRNECFLVVCDPAEIVGYLDMTVERHTWQGWIEHLIVEPSRRRRGLAMLLMQAAERWALGSELSSVAMIVQSKNEPAIRLLTKRGYAFSGFIDHYFSNGDVGLLYSLYLSTPG